MHSFIAISRTPGTPARADIEARAASGLALIAPDSAVEKIELPGEITLLYAYAGKIRAAATPESQPAFFLGSRNFDESLGRERSLEDILEAISGKGPIAVATMAPPFAVAWQNEKSYSVATDRYGLIHVFGHQGEGLAVVSSSALLIGRALGLECDKKGISQLALLGHLHGTSTTVKNVERLGHASSIHLEAGNLTTTRYQAIPDAVTNRFSNIDEAADAGASILSELGESLITTYPDCGIDLSGGIDTRLALAALPGSSLNGRKAFTIGSPESDDYKIAHRLANDYGMEHEFINLSAIRNSSVEDLARFVRQGSLKNDCSFSALDSGLFEWLRSQVGGAARITGQNGEIARGFYSTAQKLDAPVTTHRIENIVRWQIVSQASQARALFKSGFLDDGITELISDIQKMFRGFGADWGDASDRYYLYGRMQFWGGRGLTGGAAERVILAPFFEEKFVDWAFRIPPELRRGAKAFSAAMERADPALARIALDSGLTPLQMISGGSKFAKATIKLKKGVTKVRERYSTSRRPSNGTHFLGGALQGEGKEKLIDADRLIALGIFDETRVRAAASPETKVAPAEFGFLLSVNWLCSFIAGDDIT